MYPSRLSNANDFSTPQFGILLLGPNNIPILAAYIDNASQQLSCSDITLESINIKFGFHRKIPTPLFEKKPKKKSRNH